MTRHINGSRTAASASLLHLMANESKSVSILDKVTQPSLTRLSQLERF
jgi:hypothetical protein